MLHSFANNTSGHDETQHVYHLIESIRISLWKVSKNCTELNSKTWLFHIKVIQKMWNAKQNWKKLFVFCLEEHHPLEYYIQLFVDAIHNIYSFVDNDGISLARKTMTDNGLLKYFSY